MHRSFEIGPMSFSQTQYYNHYLHNVLLNSFSNFIKKNSDFTKNALPYLYLCTLMVMNKKEFG